MPKKTQEEKNEKNREILLSLLGETEKEFESQEEKDGITLENVVIDFEDKNE